MLDLPGATPEAVRIVVGEVRECGARERTYYCVKMRTGTLYGALERLLGQGLIEVHEEQIVDSRLRRTYSLTAEGRESLAAEAQRIAATAREAARRLGVSGETATA
ncbi:PadR family transcriptional regulator [Streptomyces virginiae]